MGKKSQAKAGMGGLIIGIVAAVIIIGLIGIIIYLLNSRGEEPEEKQRNVVVTSENVEDIIASMELAEYVEPGYYSASMTNQWHFSKGDAVSEDAFVENLEENTNDVYFDVFLASDETTPILESPVIPRGAKLDNIALDTPLEKGTYDCVMVYHLVDENQKTVSTLRVGITVIVEN